jgi:hypothetical protein
MATESTEEKGGTVSQINAANIIQIYETMTLTMTFLCCCCQRHLTIHITFHDFQAMGYQAI